MKAEISVDDQYGPIVTVTIAGNRVSVYLMDQTGILTNKDGQCGLEVHGNWTKFKEALKIVGEDS